MVKIELNEYSKGNGDGYFGGISVVVNGMEIPYHNLSPDGVLAHVLSALGVDAEITHSYNGEELSTSMSSEYLGVAKVADICDKI